MPDYKYISLEETKNKVESFLKQSNKYVMRVFHEDTYSIYDTDKKTICMATKSTNPNLETKYNVMIDDMVIPKMFVMQKCDFGDNRYCKKIYDLMNQEYTIGGSLPIKPRKEISRSQVKSVFEVHDKQKQRKDLISMLSKLISYRCPMSVIKRDFYTFDSVDKKNSQNFIDMLDAAGTFYVYHTLNGKMIAYVDAENNSYGLSPMTASAQALVKKLQQYSKQQQR